MNPSPGRARQIAPPAPPAVSAEKEGCLKVRLCYLTNDPKHIRNLILKGAYSIQGPYNEDICILVPAEKVFADFESYLNAFEHLQRSGVLNPEDILLEAKVLVEDEYTLAYEV